jgi:malate synthase
MLDGQINLRDAVRETISLEAAAGGKSYKLNEKHAVLLVRCAFPFSPSTFRPTFRLPLSRLTPSLFVLAVGRQPPWLAPL